MVLECFGCEFLGVLGRGGAVDAEADDRDYIAGCRNIQFHLMSKQCVQ